MQLMQPRVQKSTSTTRPTSDAGVSTGPFSHSTIPVNSGIASASTGRPDGAGTAAPSVAGATTYDDGAVTRSAERVSVTRSAGSANTTAPRRTAAATAERNSARVTFMPAA